MIIGKPFIIKQDLMFAKLSIGEKLLTITHELYAKIFRD